MDRDLVAQQVRTFVQDNFVYGQGSSLGDGDSFLEGGIIDSTGILELIAFLSRQYDISIQDEEAIPENLDSIRSVSAFVVRKRNGSANLS